MIDQSVVQTGIESSREELYQNQAVKRQLSGALQESCFSGLTAAEVGFLVVKPFKKHPTNGGTNEGMLSFQ